VLDLTLRLQRLNDGTLVLRLPPLFRFIFGLMAVVISIGMANAGAFYPFPTILIVASAAAVVYEERWFFRADSGMIEYRFGLVFAFRSRRYELDDVSFFRVSEFTKGQHPSERKPDARFFQRRHIAFSFESTSHGLINIETQPIRAGNRLRENARQIASHCDKPLHDE